jgi:hypothetical protein
MAEILRMVQPVADKEFVRSIEADKLHRMREMLGDVLVQQAQISIDLGWRSPNNATRVCSVRPESTMSSTKRMCFPSRFVSGSYTNWTFPDEIVPVAVARGHQKVHVERALDLSHQVAQKDEAPFSSPRTSSSPSG